LRAIQYSVMSDYFPYPILSKQQLISQINYFAALHIPFLFVLDYKATSGYVIRYDELDPLYIQFQFETQKPKTKKQDQDTFRWEIRPVSLKEYQVKFDYVQQQIYRGNSFLVNLTQPTEIQTDISLLDIYERSSAKYKLWIKDFIVVLSPETFIRIDKGIISSYPMKGTIDASIPEAAQNLLNDPKEMAEHATIVDLIRNDLSLVATEVEVKRYRYIDRLKTNRQDLLQVSSEINGRLADNYLEQLGDILFKLLPAGSICGAPKAKTLEIIQEAEGYERGFYSGICGYFDGENLDAGVMIRFIEQEKEKLIFKSGGGITARSELIKEYEELIQKVYVPVY